MTPLPLAILLLTMAIAPASGEEARMQASIQEVKERHQAQLMAIPGVVSVGIARDENGEPVIVVGLDREAREMQKPVPQSLEGYRVRTQVVGKIRAR